MNFAFTFVVIPASDCAQANASSAAAATADTNEIRLIIGSSLWPHGHQTFSCIFRALRNRLRRYPVRGGESDERRGTARSDGARGSPPRPREVGKSGARELRRDASPQVRLHDRLRGRG